MDERSLNSSSQDNSMSSCNLSTSMPEDASPLSPHQLYTCSLYQFVTTGVIQLIISIVGLVGETTDSEQSYK